MAKAPVPTKRFRLDQPFPPIYKHAAIKYLQKYEDDLWEKLENVEVSYSLLMVHAFTELGRRIVRFKKNKQPRELRLGTKETHAAIVYAGEQTSGFHYHIAIAQHALKKFREASAPTYQELKDVIAKFQEAYSDWEQTSKALKSVFYCKFLWAKCQFEDEENGVKFAKLVKEY